MRGGKGQLELSEETWCSSLTSKCPSLGSSPVWFQRLDRLLFTAWKHTCVLAASVMGERTPCEWKTLMQTSSRAHSVSTLTEPSPERHLATELSVPATLRRGPWKQGKLHGQR